MLTSLPFANVWYPGVPLWTHSSGTPGYSMANLTLDAATEKIAFVGQLRMVGRATSKTFSSAGGKIYWQAGSPTTFANAGTTLRVGLQDMDATDTTLPGQPDGTFDVHDDLVGGTDTITALTTQTVAMSSGSKTLSHGDVVAVVFDMTARGGSDSVLVQIVSGSAGGGLPYALLNTGSWASQAGWPLVALEMDDGTLATLEGVFPMFHSNGNAVTYSSSSSPNEYGIIYQLPFPHRIGAVRLLGSFANGSADGSIVVYSDPLGSPTAIHTENFDASYLHSTFQRPYVFNLSSELDLSANTNYAVCLKPSTTNSVTLGRWDVNTTPSKLLELVGGPNFKQVSRSSGAFTATSDFCAFIDVRITGLDDGAGGAGGLITHPGMAGGMRG